MPAGVAQQSLLRHGGRGSRKSNSCAFKDTVGLCGCVHNRYNAHRPDGKEASEK